MKNHLQNGVSFVLFALIAFVAGCAGPAARAVPVAAVDLSAPLPAGVVLHQLEPDFGLVLRSLPDHWVVSTEATREMLEHQAEHEQENARRAGQPITTEEAMQRARQYYAVSRDLSILNTRSDAHLIFSFVALSPRQPEPSADHVAESARIAAAGVTAEGWDKHSEEHRSIAISGAQHAQLFTIDYTRDGEKQKFAGVVGYAQPYWFWFYAYDHFHDPDDRQLLMTILETFEVRTAR